MWRQTGFVHQSNERSELERKICSTKWNSRFSARHPSALWNQMPAAIVVHLIFFHVRVFGAAKYYMRSFNGHYCRREIKNFLRNYHSQQRNMNERSCDVENSHNAIHTMFNKWNDFSSCSIGFGLCSLEPHRNRVRVQWTTHIIIGNKWVSTVKIHHFLPYETQANFFWMRIGMLLPALPTTTTPLHTLDSCILKFAARARERERLR